ncbi:MAG: hypothetical protein ACRYG4_17465 [Janthinobacterium lividum]
MDRGIDILRNAGEALYGARWQTPLSRDLGVTDRTIRNWSANRHDGPVDLPQKLLTLLRIRGEIVNELIAQISRQIDGNA